jgi:hypothetical protein
MSSSETTGRPVILLVSATDDEPVRDCVARLIDVGATVTVLPHVYAATARLALGEPVSNVLLDIRVIDDYEMAFLRTAARYYPSVEITVPLFKGTIERVAAYGASVRAMDVDSIVASTVVRPSEASTGEPSAVRAAPGPPPRLEPDIAHEEQRAVASPRKAEVPLAPAASPAPGPPSAVHHEQPRTDAPSTDGGPDGGPEGPALHESVRARMAGNDPRIVRRAPPRVGPKQTRPGDGPGSSPAGPAPTGNQPSPPPDGPALSPEEVDALLANEEPTERDSPGPVDDEHGGTS